MYVVKVHRQHTSLVMTIPKDIRERLCIKAGDIVMLNVSPGNKSVHLAKFNPKDFGNGRDKRNSDRAD